MAQAVRLLASMQLPSETLKKILAPAERRTADVLFYTGCNVLRTPHIVLNVMDILDALELDFDVVGGTAHCCGVYQFQEADLPTYERMGHRTFQRFGQSGASKVLTWCPTCTKNFDELEKDVEEPAFDLGHVSEFLAANLDALKARFVANQPKRRVVIHEHLGIGATVGEHRQASGRRAQSRAAGAAAGLRLLLCLRRTGGEVQGTRAGDPSRAGRRRGGGRRRHHRHHVSFLPSRARRRRGDLSDQGGELHRRAGRSAGPRRASRLLPALQAGRRDGRGGRPRRGASCRTTVCGSTRPRCSRSPPTSSTRPGSPARARPLPRPSRLSRARADSISPSPPAPPRRRRRRSGHGPTGRR